MAAKISPENSFAESKYTSVESGDEQRDSANPSPVANGGVNEKPKDDQQSQANGSDQKVDDSVTTPTEIIVDENQSPTRNPPPIASPPLSLCSLHSGDSGKGSSPPNSVGAPSITYDFLIPVNLIGIIIGRKGQFVNNIKAKTGANVIVKKNTHSKKSKICTIEGTQVEIDAALKMIRTKLPEKKYPHLTLERIVSAPESTLIPSFDASVLHLHLIEGINNDVTISTIISGGHIFLQQPLHPSFPSLNMLQQYMNQTYSMTEAPLLPLSNVIEDAICVVSVQNNWYRVQIVSHNPQTQTCLVKYLDFGGYISVLASELRQIRTDFMTVPFQAMECLLSNIRPKGDEWSKEAADTLFSLTNGVILQAQVVDYSSDNLPEVFLFRAIAKDNVIFINQELVARGLADWVEKEQEAES
jgi:A-kinase anchor protein 1